MLKLLMSAAIAVLAAGVCEVRSEDDLRLTLAAGEAGRAELVFRSNMTASDAFVLQTTRVGAPGSLITLSIDRADADLFRHTLTAEECDFSGGDGARCEVEIAGGSAAYDGLVDAFKAGLTAHLEITNAGSTAMRNDVSLAGFTRAFEGL